MAETTPTDLDAMASRLRLLVAALDLSDAEFSRQIHASPQNVSGWMRGQSRPSIDRAWHIYRAFGVPADWIWWGAFEWALPHELRLKIQTIESSTSDSTAFAR